MTEYEGSYTKEDLQILGLDDEDIESINNHPLGDGERDLNQDKIKKQPVEEILNNEIIEEVPIGIYNGNKIYPSETNDYYKKVVPQKENNIEKNNTAEEIFRVFEDKKEELKKNNDSRHIFLLTKGQYVEGVGKSSKYRGKLVNNALVIKNGNNLNFIYSFNGKGSDKFQLNYKTSKNSLTPFKERTVLLKPDVEINPKTTNHLDLNKEKNVESLRSKLVK